MMSTMPLPPLQESIAADSEHRRMMTNAFFNRALRGEEMT
jgi:hypothetical protein